MTTLFKISNFCGKYELLMSLHYKVMIQTNICITNYLYFCQNFLVQGPDSVREYNKLLIKVDRPKTLQNGSFPINKTSSLLTSLTCEITVQKTDCKGKFSCKKDKLIQYVSL